MIAAHGLFMPRLSIRAEQGITNTGGSRHGHRGAGVCQAQRRYLLVVVGSATGAAVNAVLVGPLAHAAGITGITAATSAGNVTAVTMLCILSLRQPHLASANRNLHPEAA